MRRENIEKTEGNDPIYPSTRKTGVVPTTTTTSSLRIILSSPIIPILFLSWNHPVVASAASTVSNSATSLTTTHRVVSSYHNDMTQYSSSPMLLTLQTSLPKHSFVTNNHRLHHPATKRIWGQNDVLSISRGGSTETNDEAEDEESEEESEAEDMFDDDEDEEDSLDDEYDEYDYEEEEEEFFDAQEKKEEKGNEIESVATEVNESAYDSLIPPSPIQQMAVTIGVMYFSKKLDFTNPKVVRLARIYFLAYIILTQLFLIYVRIRAKQNRNIAPIAIPTHPLLSSLLPSTAPTIAKDLASKLLSSQSNVMEYDIAQANQMNNKLLFPLVFLWFIHFKMGQVQPLLFQASSGIFNLMNSPLWQVYVLGKNLERPWKMVGLEGGSEEKGEEEKEEEEQQQQAEEEEEEEEEYDQEDEEDEVMEEESEVEDTEEVSETEESVVEEKEESDEGSENDQNSYDDDDDESQEEKK